jgi:hypothetical protein
MLLIAGCGQANKTDIGEANQDVHVEQTQEPAPTPEPTANPAEQFAQEHVIILPDVEAELIIDIDEIAAILQEEPFWSGVEDEALQGELDEILGETAGSLDLMSFGEDGRYLGYNDFIGDLYYGGQWSIQDGKIRIEEMSGTDTQVLPVMAQVDNVLHLYLYYDEQNTAMHYTVATQEEIGIMTTDNENNAIIRTFLCSASWEQRGTFDESGAYQESSSRRVYTFLSDGQMVLREGGEDIAGEYILNAELLDYRLEDGQTFSGMFAVDNSTNISYIYLYPDFLSEACDVYWAVSKRNVSDTVTEGEAIQLRTPEAEESLWSLKIGGREVTSEELASNLDLVSGEYTITYMDQSTEVVTAEGYLLQDILEYLGITDYDTITISYDLGFKNPLNQELIDMYQNMLIVKNSSGYLAVPMFAATDIFPDSEVVEIVVE